MIDFELLFNVITATRFRQFINVGRSLRVVKVWGTIHAII